MVNLLKMPPVLSGLCFHGQHGNREKIISRPDPAVEIRPRIPRGEVYKAQLRVHCRRLPYRGAAVLPRFVVLRPRLMAHLARARDCVESPDRASIFRVVSFHTASRAVLSAGKADDDQPIEIKRRGGDREPLLPALGLNGPHRFA